ncbi:MAG: hypothetical protein RLZZ86_2916 [Cyanobacteriota bacterium]|jgi:uncharacterized protein YjbI with pentapeptide repeats
MDAKELLSLYAAGERYFHDICLMYVDLSNANLEGADLSFADFMNANLSGTNLSHANLVGSHLREANLTGANLINTNLIEKLLLFHRNFFDITNFKNEELFYCFNFGKFGGH